MDTRSQKRATLPEHQDKGGFHVRRNGLTAERVRKVVAYPMTVYTTPPHATIFLMPSCHTTSINS
jgi:hypothetical protein